MLGHELFTNDVLYLEARGRFECVLIRVFICVVSTCMNCDCDCVSLGCHPPVWPHRPGGRAARAPPRGPALPSRARGSPRPLPAPRPPPPGRPRPAPRARGAAAARAPLLPEPDKRARARAQPRAAPRRLGRAAPRRGPCSTTRAPAPPPPTPPPTHPHGHRQAAVCAYDRKQTKPQTLNPTPQTPNPKPHPPNPTSQAPNPTLQTPRPKSYTPQMGTDKESFVEMTERIGRKTGGVSVYPFTRRAQGAG